MVSSSRSGEENYNQRAKAAMLAAPQSALHPPLRPARDPKRRSPPFRPLPLARRGRLTYPVRLPVQASRGVCLMFRCLLPALLVGLSPLAARAAGPVAADLVLVNGKIWTVNKARAEAEALACWRGR